MIDPQQLSALKSVYPHLELGEESSTSFIVIKGMGLPHGCDPAVVDGLLCPTARDGYPSRLFVSQQVVHGGEGKNWNSNGVRILSRSWWAVSWKIPERQTLLQMVQNHLLAFQHGR